MGNRVGVIFHEDYELFSPLLYSHNGGNLITEQFIEEYLDSYHEIYLVNDDGHKYDCEHMMYGFIQGIGIDLHNRISSINDSELKLLHEYKNCFENGCFLVNVSFKNYGIIENT